MNGLTPAEILQPLYTAATKKISGTTFKKMWDTEKLQAHFDNAKTLLLKAATLSHPDPQAPIALTTDASKNAIGGVLEQYVGGVWQPLGFWSKHLKPDKTAWSTFKRELDAVQQAMRTLPQRRREGT